MTSLREDVLIIDLRRQKKAGLQSAGQPDLSAIDSKNL